MKVLVNAYAVSPAWGSEPGMGWNWIINIARYCELFVITEGEWENEIENALVQLPYKNNLHFYYLPVSDKVRRMCWHQGDWRFYIHYRKWQKRALKKAIQICEDVDIDVVHQLNMVGFREPGCLWELSKPLVWGPIGGIGESVKGFLENAPLNLKVLLYIKDYLSTFQLRFSSYINKMFQYSDAIISAVPAMRELIKRYKHRDSILIPETGCYDLKVKIEDKRQREDFHILWVGRFIYTKRLDIAIKTIALIKDLPKIHFHIIGDGDEDEVIKYKNLSKQLNIEHLCIWHGLVDNSRVHEMMRESDIFFFTSIREATSTVIPEAINNCLPIVCFDTCGFGPLVNEKVGNKIKLSSPDQAVKDFAIRIKELYHNKQMLYEMSNNCKTAIRSLLWEDKAKRIVELYKKIMIDS